MKSYFLTFFLLLSCFSLVAQETTETNTLENQFDEIYRTSTSYQKYKVIGKIRFQKLKTDVLDSLNSIKKNSLEKEDLLKTKDNTIKSTQRKINTIQLELDNLNKKENTVSFFGNRIKKTTYSIIVWSIIVFLFISLLYFSYKFFSSNSLTKEAKNSLTNLEDEFEQYKKKSLTNEQKLRRQLQDEINKQRNL